MKKTPCIWIFLCVEIHTNVTLRVVECGCSASYISDANYMNCVLIHGQQEGDSQLTCFQLHAAFQPKAFHHTAAAEEWVCIELLLEEEEEVRLIRLLVAACWSSTPLWLDGAVGK